MPIHSRYGSMRFPGGLAVLLSIAWVLGGCGGGSGSGGGPPSFTVARAIAVDGDGNVYFAGETDTAVGDVSYGGMDTFVIKNNRGGAQQWVQQSGSGTYDTAQGVAVDNQGNVYVAGYTQYNPENPASSWSDRLLLEKYDRDGIAQWYLILDTNDTTGANAVATDRDGNVIVAGFTVGSIDGTPNAGRQDLFVLKVDGNGNVLWSRQMGTSEDDYAKGVAVDRSGNILVTGTTYGSLDGNAGVGGGDFFVLKFDTAGTRLWSRQMGTSSTDSAYGIAVDGGGNVVVAGYTYGNMGGTGNAGVADLFVTKLDADGNHAWSRQVGSSYYDSANAVAVDAGGNVYVAGDTLGALDGNTNADIGAWDIVLVKFDSAGNRLWTRQWGGVGSQSAMGVAVDDAGYIHTAGYFSGAGGSTWYLVARYDSEGNRR